MKKRPLLLAVLALPSAFVLQCPTAYAGQPASPLGDLSSLQTFANDTLALIGKHDLRAARTRITDFETAWDKAEPTLRPKDIPEWSLIDDAADAAIAALRARKPDAAIARTTVSSLIDTLQHPRAH